MHHNTGIIQEPLLEHEHRPDIIQTPNLECESPLLTLFRLLIWNMNHHPDIIQMLNTEYWTAAVPL
jgi:hypothetical protein